MAKVIEFCVPKNFHKLVERVSQAHSGKLIEFRSPTRKSA